MSWHSIHHGKPGAYVLDPRTGELHPEDSPEAAAIIAAADAEHTTSGFSAEIEAAVAATPRNPADEDRADGVVSELPAAQVAGSKLPDPSEAQQEEPEAPPVGDPSDDLTSRRAMRRRRKEH